MLRRPALIALSLGVLSAVAVPALAPAAHAETWSHRDATGDVVTIRDDAGEDEQVAAPGDRVTDVRRVTVAHTRRAVRVVVRVRDLTSGNQVLQVLLHGSRGTSGLVGLVRVSGEDRVVADTYIDESDRESHCPAADGRVRPHRGTVTLVIPTSCLHHPEWVRVSVLYGTFEGRPARAETVHLDDALSRSFDAFSGGAPSPRIHVG